MEDTSAEARAQLSDHVGNHLLCNEAAVDAVGAGRKGCPDLLDPAQARGGEDVHDPMGLGEPFTPLPPVGCFHVPSVSAFRAQRTMFRLSTGGG